MVECARRKREAGVARREAVLAACRLRLRPIIMISLAFVLGVPPLAVASGAGAEMQWALGVTVFAGMLGVTGFGPIPLPEAQAISPRPVARLAAGQHFPQKTSLMVADGDARGASS
jgi:Cu/Ag efflux pump CusA